jgi:hypothetical protein
MKKVRRRLEAKKEGLEVLGAETGQDRRRFGDISQVPEI